MKVIQWLFSSKPKEKKTATRLDTWIDASTGNVNVAMFSCDESTHKAILTPEQACLEGRRLLDLSQNAERLHQEWLKWNKE
jgi:hypothetical protein